MIIFILINKRPIKIIYKNSNVLIIYPPSRWWSLTSQQNSAAAKDDVS